ncbi:hypothetical protein GCM10025771_39950 [Niveibacterium umoris]|uniref:Pilus assembly protein PilO n=1 Tax=Niveibacterium umoris TaxID=1193620 RepID=A0A840BDN0_9RHOO|nr:hypothetical protein [Niveibacterium umoris]MBB4010803.1 hypothetical protein [Niveibacterium umoris]
MKLQPLVRWHLRRASTHLGTPGLFGIIMTLGALVAYQSHILPQYAKLAEAEADHARDERVLRASLAMPVGGKTQEPELRLTADKDFVHLQEQLFRLATEASLTLETGDYAVTNEIPKKLNRYRISLPLRGDYPRLRRFVLAAESLPGVRLESLQLTRGQVGDRELAAQIQFSALTRIESP